MGPAEGPVPLGATGKPGGAHVVPMPKAADGVKDAGDASVGLMAGLAHGEMVGSLIVGFLTGFLGSMAGVGGGPFCVPLLGWVLGLGHKSCVGTSILCGLTTLTVGGIATFFFAQDSLNLSLLPICALAAVAPVFGYFSAKWSNSVSPLLLKRIFAGFLVFCALQIMWGLAYSPTGVEGHWEYTLKGQRHVYEIEGSEGRLLFRTHHYGGFLRKVAHEQGAPTPPQGFEKGWYSKLRHLKQHSALPFTGFAGFMFAEGSEREREVAGHMWVRVLDRDRVMETVFHSFRPGDHWNDPITATRTRAWYADMIANSVASDVGNVCFHLLIALIAGTASGLLGIAGGSVVVPLMSLTGAYPWQTITATSLLSMIPTSFTTCYTHYLQGNVAMRYAPGLVAGTITGAYGGSSLMAVVSETVRKGACAGVLLFTAFIMLYQSTKHLFVRDKNAAAGDSGRSHLVRLLCISVVFFSFAAVIKERVFNQSETSGDRILSCVNAILCAIFATADWRFTAGRGAEYSPTRSGRADTERRCPMTVYALLVLLMAAEAHLLSWAGELLEPAAFASAKSGKLLCVIAMRVVVGCVIRHYGGSASLGAVLQRAANMQAPSLKQIASAVGVCGGTAALLASTLTMQSTRVTHLAGVVYIAAALALEASTYVIEEVIVFGRHQASVLEVLWALSVWSIPVSFLYLDFLNDISSDWLVLQREWRFPTLALAYAICNYLGMKYVLQIVQEYDATLAVLSQSVRKVATVVLTFALFPAGVSLLQCVCLGAVGLSVYAFLSTHPIRKDA